MTALPAQQAASPAQVPLLEQPVDDVPFVQDVGGKHCAFCLKHQERVTYMLQGLTGSIICDECVRNAVDTLNKVYRASKKETI